MTILSTLLRSYTFRVLIAVILLVTPFILLWLTPRMGTRVGLFPAIGGVLLGVLFERPFRPYNVTPQRWMGRVQWAEIALAAGFGLGMLASIVDYIGRGVPYMALMLQVWIPAYRAAMFACGLTLLRRVVWEWDRERRVRVRAPEALIGNAPLRPALPGAPEPVGGSEGVKTRKRRDPRER